MVALSLHLELLFWGAVALNLCNLLLFLTRRRTKGLLVLPWIGVVWGLAWFAACREYLIRPELSLSLPVRIDLMLLPVLMLCSLGIGVVRLIPSVKAAKQRE